MTEPSADVVIDLKKVAKTVKILCDVLESRNVDKVTACAAMHVLISELEEEGVVVEVTRKTKGMH